VRDLPADDPRNIHHPCHREQWLELARAIGRMEARQEFEQLIRQKRLRHDKPRDEAAGSKGCIVRPILK
jgi:hypothetical protein